MIEWNVLLIDRLSVNRFLRNAVAFVICTDENLNGICAIGKYVVPTFLVVSVCDGHFFSGSVATNGRCHLVYTLTPYVSQLTKLLHQDKSLFLVFNHHISYDIAYQTTEASTIDGIFIAFTLVVVDKGTCDEESYKGSKDYEDGIKLVHCIQMFLQKYKKSAKERAIYGDI